MTVFTLLLTSAGGALSVEAVRIAKSSLRHSIRVIAVDALPDAVARFFADAFFVVPRGDDDGFAEAVEAIVASERVDLVLPGSDEEAFALSFAQERFAALGCRISVSSEDTMRTLKSKASTFERLRKGGLSCIPSFVEVLDFEALAAAITAYPTNGDIVVKPVAGRGGRGVSIIEGSERASVRVEREARVGRGTFLTEHLPWYRNQMPVLIMDRLSEPVYDVDVLADRGRVLQAVPRKRLDSARPNAGHIFIDAPELVAIAEAVASILNLHGLYDIDLMYDDFAKPWLLEVNPRPSGSWPVTAIAGVPLLDELISLIMDEPAGPRPDVAGTTVVPHQSLLRVRPLL